jgi:hypothetical protein
MLAVIMLGVVDDDEFCRSSQEVTRARQDTKLIEVATH